MTQVQPVQDVSTQWYLSVTTDFLEGDSKSVLDFQQFFGDLNNALVVCYWYDLYGSLKIRNALSQPNFVNESFFLENTSRIRQRLTADVVVYRLAYASPINIVLEVPPGTASYVFSTGVIAGVFGAVRGMLSIWQKVHSIKFETKVDDFTLLFLAEMEKNLPAIMNDKSKNRDVRLRSAAKFLADIQTIKLDNSPPSK